MITHYEAAKVASDMRAAELEAQAERARESQLERYSGELSGESIMISRGHLKHLGMNPPWFDDGVHVVVIELLEFRRRFNDGKPLELEGFDEPLCGRCQMDKRHHGMPTIQCDGYQTPDQHWWSVAYDPSAAAPVLNKLRGEKGLA